MAVSRACSYVSSGLTLANAMPDATIHAVAKILEKLSPALYRVELPNGKRILAHLSKPLTEAKAAFATDEDIVVELTPYDFDNARILREA